RLVSYECTMVRQIPAWRWPLGTPMTCCTGSRAPKGHLSGSGQGREIHAHCYACTDCLACATTTLRALGARCVATDGRLGGAWSRCYALCHGGLADTRAACRCLPAPIFRRSQLGSEGLRMPAYCAGLRAG